MSVRVMRGSSLRWALAASIAYAVIGVASFVAPDAVLRVAAKEGLVEELSHVVLLAAIVAWSLRARVRPRWPAIAVAATLAIVLAEELDWGGVYGATGGTAMFGRASLHGAWSGSAYVLFAAPWVLWYGLAFAPTRWRARVGSHAATRDEAIAVAIVAAVSLASSFIAIEWERALDEIDEAILYILVLASGLREREVPS